MKRELLTEDTLKLIKERKEDSSKGDFGVLLSLCGCETMTGAAYLSSTAALRSGLGLLRFCGDEKTLVKMQSILFEPVFLNIDSISDAKCDAFLCGCGIGRSYDALLEGILTSTRVPAVLDADCINFLSMHMDVLEKIKCPTILTPHPGEMARLLQTDIASIQADREGCARRFATTHGVYLVLKGKGTVIAEPDGSLYINTTGSSALAKGGSGDVLAGVIASLVAQGYDLSLSCRIGVYVHGLAADRLALEYGKSGVLPSDLPKEIGRIIG
ncbi:MAG: NAD(P)H-hydrate dehydratase [Clostridia bacterium]|nr:NAD(P)H-hydrate dehydratase [Clostridia bacterium]